MPILSNSGVKNGHFSLKNPYFPFKNGDFKGGGLNKAFFMFFIIFPTLSSVQLRPPVFRGVWVSQQTVQ